MARPFLTPEILSSDDLEPLYNLLDDNNFAEAWSILSADRYLERIPSEDLCIIVSALARDNKTIENPATQHDSSFIKIINRLSEEKIEILRNGGIHTSLTNNRSYPALKFLLENGIMDINLRIRDDSGRLGKDIFTSIAEQYGKRPEDAPFMSYLIGTRSIRGLEGQISDLLLHAIAKGFNPKELEIEKDRPSSDGEDLRFNEAGIPMSFVRFFSDKDRMRELLSSYFGDRHAAEMALDEIYDNKMSAKPKDDGEEKSGTEYLPSPPAAYRRQSAISSSPTATPDDKESTNYNSDDDERHPLSPTKKPSIDMIRAKDSQSICSRLVGKCLSLLHLK